MRLAGLKPGPLTAHLIKTLPKALYMQKHNRTTLKKNEEYRKIEFDRRRTIEIENVPVCFAAPEDLILSKLLWAKDSLSEIQLRDVKNILENTISLDKNYLEKWVVKLDISNFYKKALL